MEIILDAVMGTLTPSARAARVAHLLSRRALPIAIVEKRSVVSHHPATPPTPDDVLYSRFFSFLDIFYLFLGGGWTITFYADYHELKSATTVAF